MTKHIEQVEKWQFRLLSMLGGGYMGAWIGPNLDICKEVKLSLLPPYCVIGDAKYD